MIVYLLTNKIDGKRYVGITTKSLEKRFAQHVSMANSNVRTSRQLIVRAIKKHGESNFIAEILEMCEDKETLCEREMHWIETLKTRANFEGHNGYNLTDGGEGLRGYIASDETRELMRKAHLKENLSDTSRQAISVAARRRYFDGHGAHMRSRRKRGEQHPFYKRTWRKDFTVTQETREKISRASTGKKLSEEHKRSISDSLRGRPGVNNGKKASKDTLVKLAFRSHLCKKPVAEYDLLGTCVCVHLSCDDATSAHVGTQMTYSRICRSLKNCVHIYGMLFVKSQLTIKQLREADLTFGENRKDS
jgi:group I intron endonuclease